MKSAAGKGRCIYAEVAFSLQAAGTRQEMGSQLSHLSGMLHPKRTAVRDFDLTHSCAIDQCIIDGMHMKTCMCRVMAMNTRQKYDLRFG